jgi:branched-chain amino acid transport system permease protein
MSATGTISRFSRPATALPVMMHPVTGLIVLALLLCIAPFLLADYQLTLVATGAAYSVAVLGVAAGFATVGMLALTQPAMMLIGAYVSLYAVETLGFSFFPSALLAIVAGALVALPLGWITCRLDKFSFAVLGFAFTYLVSMLMSSNLLVGITGGELGKPFPPADLFGIELHGDASYAALAACVFIAYLLAPTIFRSTMGRFLIVMRQDDVLAKSVGVDTNLHRILLTAIVSAYGAFSGVLIGLASGFVAPPHFDVALSISLLAMALVGGTRYLLGSAAGTLVLLVLPAMLNLPLIDRNLMVGIVLLVCLIFMPEGLLSFGKFVRVSRATPSSEERTI